MQIRRGPATVRGPVTRNVGSECHWGTVPGKVSADGLEPGDLTHRHTITRFPRGRLGVAVRFELSTVRFTKCLVFLSSSLRHHLEDKILGTSTGAGRLASGHNADGYVLDDSDSKENQLSKAVSRKSALTPNARSTRSAPRVGAGDRARGGRELVSLTVVALKERCAAAGLKKTGRKADLIARLRAHAEAADGEQR